MSDGLSGADNPCVCVLCERDEDDSARTIFEIFCLFLFLLLLLGASEREQWRRALFLFLGAAVKNSFTGGKGGVGSAGSSSVALM